MNTQTKAFFARRGRKKVAQEIRTHSADEKLVQERRNHISLCAIRVFVEKGYKATTMRELAQVCGMAQGAIYHYIGAKDDILHLLCAKAASGGSLMRAYLKSLGHLSPTEAIVACIREYYRWADQDQENYIFFNREIINFSPEDRHILLKSQVEIMQVFEKLLEKGNRTGDFKVDNPALVAHNIVILGYEWAVRRWYLKPRFTLKEYTEMQTTLLLRQLGVGEEKIAGLLETETR